MPKPLPPLTWFRAFEAAARHLSFTAAAAEIGLTQSAVSQQVKALETRLRVTLFTRQARGLALTDDGRKLLPQVGKALDDLAAATGLFDAGATEDVLTVAASVSVIEWVIAPHLHSFRAAHPGLRIRLLSAIWPDDFNTSRADVEIRFGSEKQVGKDAAPLVPNDLVALTSPRLKGQLKDLPLIEAVGTSDGWVAWGNAAGYPTLRPNLFVDSYGVALQLAVQGCGVALASSLLAGHALSTGLLVPADEFSITAQEGYFLSADTSVKPGQAFREWILSRLAT